MFSPLSKTFLYGFSEAINNPMKSPKIQKPRLKKRGFLKATNIEHVLPHLLGLLLRIEARPRKKRKEKKRNKTKKRGKTTGF